MYPRNAASPERIAIGPVLLIADGTVQTAGVTVRIIPFGGSEADGAGTTAYSTDGVVIYTPTQAETNYTSFVLIAKKSACIPASVTVVTSASSLAGHAGTDQSKITNATSTVNLSGTTIKTATDIKTDTQDIQARLPAALVDGRIVANAQVVGDKTGYTATVSDKTGFSLLPTTGLGNQTADITGSLSGSVGSVTGAVGSVTSPVAVSDKTGFKLASDGLALVTAWTVGITGNLTGNLTGSVGSISGVTFPANFGNLGIEATGEILTVATVDELGPSALSANSLQDEIARAVLRENVDDHDNVAHSLAEYISIIKKANTVIDGEVTNAAIPTTTTFTSNVAYPTGAFKHAVLLWLTGSLAEQNSPILTYNNTNGTIVVEEAFTEAPAVGDEFVIIPTTHVHSVAAIAQGVWQNAGRTLSSFDFQVIVGGYAAGQAPLQSLGVNAPAGWINAASITTDAITNDKIAASAVTKISTGVSNLEVLTRLASMIESDGAGQFRFDTIAVSLAGSVGAGGAVNITVEDRSITVT